MNRVKLTIPLFLLIYAACATLFLAAVAGSNASPLWYLWCVLGLLCLAPIALELTLLAIWLWVRISGYRSDGGVPLRLSEEDQRWLDEQRPLVAMLMPAHCEAMTEEDRAALAERICDTLRKTPPYMHFFLLADSPESERDNERRVIRMVQERLCPEAPESAGDRLFLEEYRDKPEGWRHKSGSILRWIQRHGRRYEFMYVMDADSSLMDEEPDHPETCDVIERMLIALLRDPGLAFVQASMHIRVYNSGLGWLQAVNAEIGANYYVPLFSWIYGRSAPSYGHNCLVRVKDFAQHARNTLAYTSHDHVDAADLSAAGRGCVLTTAALTYEEPEDQMTKFLLRECRWARGNGQWFVYLFRKRGLPIAPILFLSMGIAMYLWALLAAVFFTTAVALVPGRFQMISRSDSPWAWALIAVLAVALVVPRFLAGPSVGKFLLGFLISTAIAPAVMLWQGAAFLLGAFGNRWIPRGARSTSFDAHEVMSTIKFVLPVMVLGIGLWLTARHAPWNTLAGALMKITVIFMILSPLFAVLVSWPLRPAGRKEEAAAQGIIAQPARP